MGDYTDVVHIPYAPFIYFMSATTALAGLVHVYKAFVPGDARTSQATT
jgi:hypothetical protein